MLHKLTTAVAYPFYDQKKKQKKKWFSPPNYEALVGKLWPAAPGVPRRWGTGNELVVTYSAAALAALQIGASQAG